MQREDKKALPALYKSIGGKWRPTIARWIYLAVVRSVLSYEVLTLWYVLKNKYVCSKSHTDDASSKVILDIDLALEELWRESATTLTFIGLTF